MAQLSREGLIQVIASSRVEILWDVSFDITSPNIFIQKKVEHNALPGIWELALGDADGKAWFTVGVKGLSTALTGETVQVDAELQWIFGSDEGRVWSRDWGSGRFPTVALVDCIEVTYWTQAAASSGGRYDPRQHRRYRFIVNVRRGGLEDDSTDGNEDEDEEKMVGTVSKLELSSMLAQRLSGLDLAQLPHDTRLYFTRANSSAELWTNSDFLSKTAEYYKDLLNSDFAESVTRRSKRARTSTSTVEAPKLSDEDTFDDSDDESDAFWFSKHPTPSHSSEAEDVTYRQVTITQTAFTAYPRTNYLASKYSADPLLPLPVSPASLYRLAHLLGLDDLQQRCLAAFADALPSSQNVAAELFSETAIIYPQWRNVCLRYVERNRHVKLSEGWREMMRRIASGEMPEAGEVLAEVA